MRLIQFADENKATSVGLVLDENKIIVLQAYTSMYHLASTAVRNKCTLAQLIQEQKTDVVIDYQQLVDEKKLLSPVQHPDPAHTLVSGTGLTHLGSADTRAAMHAKIQGDLSNLTDSMKMFRMGVEGGKPPQGQTGVQPEWFFKGDGDIVVAPGGEFQSPSFALDGGEEPEIVGLYLIGPDKKPYRLGFALGNEFSDHKTEQINYLYLAHSKLRQCSVGPELLLGSLPEDIRGNSSIIRNGKTVWQKEFLSGEKNMSHSIANLEYHHFKYAGFLRPGDLHLHFFGTGTLSFGDDFVTQVGDVFEINSADFGRSLQNKYSVEENAQSCVTAL